jgi:hypothetical protein
MLKRISVGINSILFKKSISALGTSGGSGDDAWRYKAKASRSGGLFVGKCANKATSIFGSDYFSH